MRRVILVHGMKRSGNHGVINWLQAHGRFLFFNNVIPIAPILEGKKNIPPPEDFTTWIERRLAREPYQDYYAYEFGFRSVIASLEDHDLRTRPFARAPYKTSNVLILRDPYNMLSSRIRRASSVDDPAFPAGPGPAMNRIIKLWKEHAYEFLETTDHLDNRTCIYFNAWFSHRAYREMISKKLGLNFIDHGYSRVSRFGGGSSFDGTQYDGNNKKLDVLDRKRHLTDSEREVLEEIVADEELQELAHEIASRHRSRR